MEYKPEFARSFMQRTLDLANTYEGPHDATLLVNCLLGLLIVRKEELIKKIKEAPFNSLTEWGIQPGSIRELGKCNQGHEHEPNLRQLVHRLRNAVAHFRIDPLHKSGQVVGFSFRDQNGFHAELQLGEIRTFVSKLAAHLEEKA